MNSRYKIVNKKMMTCKITVKSYNKNLKFNKIKKMMYSWIYNKN